MSKNKNQAVCGRLLTSAFRMKGRHPPATCILHKENKMSYLAFKICILLVPVNYLRHSIKKKNIPDGLSFDETSWQFIQISRNPKKH